MKSQMFMNLQIYIDITNVHEVTNVHESTKTVIYWNLEPPTEADPGRQWFQTS